MKIWFLEQLAMYAAYHQDHRNQLTHHVGVPMIIFSLLVASSVVSLPVGSLFVPLSVVLIALLIAFYLVNEPLIGLVAGVKYGVLTFLSVSWVASLTSNGALFWALGLFVLGWIIQFVGHIFEGRKPALFDNLTQVFMAPAFLIAELLFLCGLSKGLQNDIEDRRQKYAKAQKAAKDMAGPDQPSNQPAE